MVFLDEKQIVSFVTKAILPHWQTKLFKKHRDEVQVHSQGEVFYKIDTLFPNEAPVSKALRLLAFEPITKGSFNKGIDSIMRIFNNSSYTAQASERTLNEISQNKFDNKNLFSYFLELWMQTALGYDPNALIVVYPPEFMQDKKFDQVLSVPSQHILWIDDETVVFKSEEESEVQYDTVTTTYMQEFYDYTINRMNLTERQQRNLYNTKLETKFIKTVYHCFTQNKLYVIKQVDDSNNYEATVYDCGANKLPPVTFMGGSKAQRKVYESFLSPFVYFGNLALFQHSQHTAVNFTYSFPRMSEVQRECTNPTCSEGFVSCDITDAHPEGKKQCPVCQGRGTVANQSPYNVYIRKLDTSGLQGDNSHLDYDDVKFYTPDTSILDYSKKEWKDNLDLAERAIYIKQDVTTGSVESADSKRMDLEAFFSFLARVAEMFYDRIRFVVQCEENYYNANPVQVVVNKPIGFAILSEGEAFDALNKILTSPAPSNIKAQRIDAFIDKFVSDTSFAKKAYQVLKLVDVLLYKTDNEIQLLKSNYITTAELWAKHTYAYPVLTKMYEEDKRLFDQDVKDIATELEKRLEVYQPEPSPLKNDLLLNNG